jgi:hypothetical protein
MIPRLALLALPGILIATASGCKEKNTVTSSPTGSNTPSPPDASVLPDCAPPPGECHSAACGGNSPQRNAFPVNGIRTNGDCNPDGVQLLADLIDGVGDCKNAKLDMRDGKLVGRKGKKVECEGTELQGASFEVRNSNKDKAAIKIVQVTTYKSDNGEEREAYLLESVKTPGTGLCRWQASNDFRVNELKLKPIKYLDELDEPKHNLVIALRSELYYQDGNPVEPKDKWQSHEREWINLACVDDALAKRSLYDLNNSESLSRGRKALRMLTADYCGGEPATTRGIEIAWTPGKLWESRWTESGAACLTAPRLLHTKGETPALPDYIPKHLKDQCEPGCTAAKLDKIIRTCFVPDPTQVVDAGVPTKLIEKPLDPCKPETACPPEGCKPRELDSYINLP